MVSICARISSELSHSDSICCLISFTKNEVNSEVNSGWSCIPVAFSYWIICIGEFNASSSVPFHIMIASPELTTVCLWDQNDVISVSSVLTFPFPIFLLFIQSTFHQTAVARIWWPKHMPRRGFHLFTSASTNRTSLSIHSFCSRSVTIAGEPHRI